MTNWFVVLATVAYLATAQGISSNLMKTIPTISHSLVNLGKMEISLYFNEKLPENQAATKSAAPSSPIARSHPMEPMPCPCSAFRSSKDAFLSDPSELINKLLRSNDLFKDPTSTHCCDSHEQIQESTVFLETSPNRVTINNRNPNPMKLPFLFPLPNPSFPKFNNQGLRPKAMEIFLFPKRKDIMNLDVMKSVTKPAKEFPKIQVVGDKDIKPLNEGASVKKDLANLIEKKETSGQQDDSLKVAPSTPVSNTK